MSTPRQEPTKYILDGKTPKAVDLVTWGRWFETANRVVARTSVGRAEVSTVFLGLDHRFGRTGPPLLFETMVFGGALDQEQERYATWAEAETGHAALVARAKKRK